MFRRGGAGFLRLSCAEPDERLLAAVDFMADAFQRQDRVAAFLAQRDEFRLANNYESP